jgi:hypothetical protein
VKIGNGRRRKLNSKADRDKGVVRLRKVPSSNSSNNEARYISMKLGPAGEAFFVQRNSKQLSSFNEGRNKEPTPSNFVGQYTSTDTKHAQNNESSEKADEKSITISNTVEKSDFQPNVANNR